MTTHVKHVRVVGSAAQKTSGFQLIEGRFAGCAVEIPKSLCLALREPEPGQLSVFRPNEA